MALRCHHWPKYALIRHDRSRPSGVSLLSLSPRDSDDSNPFQNTADSDNEAQLMWKKLHGIPQKPQRTGIVKLLKLKLSAIKNTYEAHRFPHKISNTTNYLRSNKLRQKAMNNLPIITTEFFRRGEDCYTWYISSGQSPSDGQSPMRIFRIPNNITSLRHAPILVNN